MKSLSEKFACRRIQAAFAMFAVASSGIAFAQNIRGSATGPTTAKGYGHPGQYMH